LPEEIEDVSSVRGAEYCTRSHHHSLATIASLKPPLDNALRLQFALAVVIGWRRGRPLVTVLSIKSIDGNRTGEDQPTDTCAVHLIAKHPHPVNIGRVVQLNGLNVISVLRCEMEDSIHSLESNSYRDRIGDIAPHREIRQGRIHDEIKYPHLMAAVDEAPR